MGRGSTGSFLERAVTVHRYDCEAIADTAGAPADAADVSLEAATPDEAVVRYAIAARPLYDGMRRSIGHVAGLLVLAQASGRRDVIGLPDLTVARERWQELRERLPALHVPRGLERHFAFLERAHAMIGEVLDGFDAAREGRDWQHHLDRASDRIKSAYACLQTASEPRAGMMMVDFKHACCSCAQQWRQKGGDNGRVFDLGS